MARNHPAFSPTCAAVLLGALSLRWPQRVDKLVLVDSHGLGKEVPWRGMSYVLVRLPLLNRVMWAVMGRSRRMIRWSLRTMFHDPQVVTKSLERVMNPRRGCRSLAGGRGK